MAVDGFISLSIYIKFILFLIFNITVVSRCPNNCSGHGLCEFSSKCSCFTGWSGGAADCSLSKFFYFFQYIIYYILNKLFIL